MCVQRWVTRSLNSPECINYMLVMQDAKLKQYIFNISEDATNLSKIELPQAIKATSEITQNVWFRSKKCKDVI